MAEYLLLATFVTVLSVSTIWTVRTFKYIGRVCYQAILPSAKSNVRKKSEARLEELPNLSEALGDIRMPWGWEPLKLAPVEAVPADPPVTRTRPLVTPWGWPGNPGRSNGHARQVTHNGHSVEDRQASDNGYQADDQQTAEADDGLLMDIRGSQFGGFYVVSDGEVPVSEARSPWGW